MSTYVRNFNYIGKDKHTQKFSEKDRTPVQGKMLFICLFWGFFHNCCHQGWSFQAPFSKSDHVIRHFPDTIKTCSLQLSNCSIEFQNPFIFRASSINALIQGVARRGLMSHRLRLTSAPVISTENLTSSTTMAKKSSTTPVTNLSISCHKTSRNPARPKNGKEN